MYNRWCFEIATWADSAVLIRDFSDVLGINSNAKFVREGFDNRDEYNKFLALDGPLQVGEQVVWRCGREGPGFAEADGRFGM